MTDEYPQEWIGTRLETYRPLTREEKIQTARGLIQLVGILIMIIGIIWMIKHWEERKLMGECLYKHEDGTQEHTGLYGNCTWYDTRLRRYTNPEQGLHLITDPPLQNTHNVNYTLTE